MAKKKQTQKSLKTKLNKPTRDLIEKMIAGDRLSLSRVISHIENRNDFLRPVIDTIYPMTGNAFILGITGPPGAGKSTVTDKLVAEIRKTNKKVAVVCIDPSSPFSGGAILGDRIRMQSHAGDQGVYIRSLGTRGKHGGLSQSSREVLMALDAAGYDWIIIETAGVGQTELDILKVAHAVCVVLVPESGDSIQVMKAGLMEIADLFVVNKADRPEAEKLVKELFTMIAMPEESGGTVRPGLGSSSSGWKIPVLKTQALFGKGIAELFEKLVEFKDFSDKSGFLRKKRMEFLLEEVSQLVQAGVQESIALWSKSLKGKKTLESVLNRKISPFEAADKVELK